MAESENEQQQDDPFASKKLVEESTPGPSSGRFKAKGDQYRCPLCQHVAPKEHNLIIHLLAMHYQDQLRENIVSRGEGKGCKHCTRIIKGETGLFYHLLSAHGIVREEIRNLGVLPHRIFNKHPKKEMTPKRLGLRSLKHWQDWDLMNVKKEREEEQTETQSATEHEDTEAEKNRESEDVHNNLSADNDLSATVMFESDYFDVSEIKTELGTETDVDHFDQTDPDSHLSPELLPGDHHNVHFRGLDSHSNGNDAASENLVKLDGINAVATADTNDDVDIGPDEDADIDIGADADAKANARSNADARAESHAVVADADAAPTWMVSTFPETLPMEPSRVVPQMLNEINGRKRKPSSNSESTFGSDADPSKRFEKKQHLESAL